MAKSTIKLYYWIKFNLKLTMAHKTSFITESFRDYINGLIAMNICQFYTEYCLFAWYRKLGFSLRITFFTTSATCSALNTISGWAQYLARLLLILSFMRRDFWSTVEQSSPAEITAVFIGVSTEPGSMSTHLQNKTAINSGYFSCYDCGLKGKIYGNWDMSKFSQGKLELGH